MEAQMQARYDSADDALRQEVIDDARRYRWLRDHPMSTWEIGYLRPHQFICKVPFADLDRIPATLDAAIDEAMRTSQGKNGG